MSPVADAASPVARANAARNGRVPPGRRRRWRAARDAAWRLLDRHVRPGARVAVVGAGNGADLPVARLARRAGRLDLIDLDRAALARARWRCGPWRRTARTIVADATGGAADAIVGATLARRPVPAPSPGPWPIGEPPYDVVIGDLLYTQLLYPALSDAGLPARTIDAVLLGPGQRLTDALVASLRAAAGRDGVVVHLHDALGWWDGHAQPTTLDAILQAGIRDPAAARALIARGVRPYGCDLLRAIRRADVLDEALWRWPFADGVDFLVQATVVRGSG